MFIILYKLSFFLGVSSQGRVHERIIFLRVDAFKASVLASRASQPVAQIRRIFIAHWKAFSVRMIIMVSLKLQT